MFRTLSIAVLLSIAAPSSAAVLTFDFIARVDNPANAVPVGTTFSGQFKYDNALSPTWSDAYDAQYEGPSIAVSFTLAGITHSTTQGKGIAFVTNDNPDSDGDYDGFGIFSPDPADGISLYFYDPTTTAFSSLSLPNAFPALYQGILADPNDDDDLTVPSGEFDYYDANTGTLLSATVLSITPSAPSGVPEPASWAMMIAGFGLVGSALRRQARTPRTTIGAIRHALIDGDQSGEHQPFDFAAFKERKVAQHG